MEMLQMDPIKYSLVMIVLGLLVIFPQVSFAQRGKRDKEEEKEEKGKLAQFEEAVEKEGKKSKGQEAQHVCQDGCCEGGDDSWLYPFFEILFQGGTELLFGFPSQYPEGAPTREYSPYPYADPVYGRFGGEAARPVSFAASGYYLYSNANLDGFGFRSRFSPHPLLGLEFQFTEFHEQLEVGKDRLAKFNLTANFHRVRSPGINLRRGLGIKGMHCHLNYTGPAYDLGVEIYPVRPVSLRLVHTGGWLNGVYVPEFYGTVNLHLGRIAVMGGYQYWSVGPVSLDGLILGVKVNI
jgi:hypothetical protein